MDPKNMQAALVPAVPTFVAVVQYTNNWRGTEIRDYDFLCDVFVKEGDFVVVESETNGFGVARVVGVKKQSSKATKWVVQRIDVSRHIQRVNDQKRRLELKSEMAKRMREADEMSRYKAVAAEDPHMAKLLKEYESLNQVLVWEDVRPQLQATEVKDEPEVRYDHHETGKDD